MNINAPQQQYKYLVFLTTGYIVSIICSIVLFTKQVQAGPFIFNGGLITYPITYFFCDIIAEVYGYSAARRANWSIIIWANLFAIATTIIIRLPSPGYFNNTQAFHQVLGYDWRFTIAGTVAFVFSSFTTAYIVSKSKIMMNGRKFFIRYIISVCIGELLDTVIVFSIGFSGILPFHKILIIMINAYFYKVIFSVILAYPAVGLSKLLKRAESCDVLDDNINYTSRGLELHGFIKVLEIKG